MGSTKVRSALTRGLRWCSQMASRSGMGVVELLVQVREGVTPPFHNEVVAVGDISDTCAH